MNDAKPANPKQRRLLSKLPGLRRYTAEIERLRQELAAAQHENDRLRAAQPDAEWLERAQRYEYYWANAFKKIDIRGIEPFGSLSARIIRDGRTYLDIDRLYTLWQMIDTLPSAATAVVEIGVYKGGSARFIAEALLLRGRPVPFYACDTFQGHVEVDEAVDGLHRVGEQFTRVHAKKVVRYLAPFPFARVLPGDIRDTAAGFAGDHGFGLVHLDVDVYPITCFCLTFFGPRMVPGGRIVVDDHRTTTCEGVTKAVREFAAANPHYSALHLLTGQAVLVRLA